MAKLWPLSLSFLSFRSVFSLAVCCAAALAWNALASSTALLVASVLPYLDLYLENAFSPSRSQIDL